MDRRNFLRATALGGSAAAATSMAAPSLAQGREKLTMVTSWPRGLAGVWDAVERFASNVNDITGGTLEVEAKAAGELVGALEVFDAVSAGQADIYHSADYYYVGQHPALAYFTTVPFGMTAPEFMVWYYSDGGMALHHELGELFNLRGFPAGQTGAQGGGWFRKEIKSVEDFQGLKFRMPGLGGQTVAKLGASVQTLPPGEIYQALSTGALDGTEWIGPWSDEKLGLQEVCDHYYPAGFHEPGASLNIAVNLERFNGLSAAHQRAIEVSAAEAHQQNYTLYISNNGPALQRLINGGTQTHVFSDDVWNAYGAAATEVLDSYMDDEIFANVRNSATESLRTSSSWMSKSDAAYVIQRNRIFGIN